MNWIRIFFLAVWLAGGALVHAERPAPQAFFKHAAGWLVWPTEEADPGPFLSTWMSETDREAILEAVDDFPNRHAWDAVEMEEFLQSLEMDFAVLLGLGTITEDYEPALRLRDGEVISVRKIIDIAREAKVSVMVVPLETRANESVGNRERNGMVPVLKSFASYRQILAAIDRLRDPERFRWYPLEHGFEELSWFERDLGFWDSRGVWRESHLSLGSKAPIILRERRINPDGEIVEVEERVERTLVEQLQTHPRWQLEGEFNFTAFMEDMFRDSGAAIDDEAWLQRYEQTNRFYWFAPWKENPPVLPAEVLSYSAYGNFYAEWYRQKLASVMPGYSTPTYATLLFLLEDLLREAGRGNELDDLTSRFNVVWGMLLGQGQGGLVSLHEADWPEPLGDLLEVLAQGPVVAREHEALSRLRAWTDQAPVGTNALPVSHFVAGLALLSDDPEAAAEHFVAVRSAVEKGSVDWDHLAVQSWGWDGLVALRQGNFFEAWELYQEGNLAGFSDIPSLIHVYKAMLSQGDDLLEEVAFIPEVLWPLTLFCLRQSPRYGRIPMTEEKRIFTQVLLDTVPPNPPLAPIMVMLADRWGYTDQRQEWMDELWEDDPMAWFLYYREALRELNVEAALAWQKQLLAAFLEDSRVSHEEPALWRYLTIAEEPLRFALARERAWILLMQEDFMEAVPWFLVVEPGMAIAIGEKLLSTAEMEQIQDRLDEDDEALWQGFLGEYGRRMWTSALTARLAREGKWEEAAALDSFEEQKMEAVLAKLQALEEGTEDPQKKAERLFAAARAIRDNGIDLASTKHTSGRIYSDGRFYDNIYPYRFRWLEDYPFEVSKEVVSERCAKQAPTNHAHGRTYRYQAAELAWQAAELLPDNDERAAEILWHGGVWLMYIDPPAANRFYRELVLRHGETDLGKTADQIRWFPLQSVGLGQ